MKMRAKPKTEPKEGDIRNRTGFLWLPKKLGNEWRWLERATWLQVCTRLTTLVPEGGGHSPGQTFLKWVSTEWD